MLDGPLPHAAQTLQRMTDVARGMAHLHKHNLIHRYHPSFKHQRHSDCACSDLAPRNVLVDKANNTVRAMVCCRSCSLMFLERRQQVNDFGLARHIEGVTDEHEMNEDGQYFRCAELSRWFNAISSAVT